MCPGRAHTHTATALATAYLHSSATALATAYLFSPWRVHDIVCGAQVFAAKAMGLPVPKQPGDLGGAEMGMGNKAPPSRDALAKDFRTWRCKRCNTMNRSTATQCVSCMAQRGSPFSANAKLHVKPAGWVN